MILNNEPRVVELYTDSLINCAQVIFWNRDATFTCHILGSAPNPTAWILEVQEGFTKEHGAIHACHLVTGGNPTTGEKVCGALSRRIPHIQRWRDCGGCAIAIATGNVRQTPSGWNTSKADIAGPLTAPDLIDRRLTHRRQLGEPQPGDYFEGCRVCRDLEF